MGKPCCRPGQHSSLPLGMLGSLPGFHGRGSSLGPHSTPPRCDFLPSAPLNHHWADPGGFQAVSLCTPASTLLEHFSYLQNPGNAPKLLHNCLGFLKEKPQAFLFHRRGSEPAGPHFINIRRGLSQPSVRHSLSARFQLQLLLSLPSNRKNGIQWKWFANESMPLNGGKRKNNMCAHSQALQGELGRAAGIWEAHRDLGCSQGSGMHSGMLTGIQDSCSTCSTCSICSRHRSKGMLGQIALLCLIFRQKS